MTNYRKSILNASNKNASEFGDIAMHFMKSMTQNGKIIKSRYWQNREKT